MENAGLSDASAVARPKSISRTSPVSGFRTMLDGLMSLWNQAARVEVAQPLGGGDGDVEPSGEAEPLIDDLLREGEPPEVVLHQRPPPLIRLEGPGVTRIDGRQHLVLVPELRHFRRRGVELLEQLQDDGTAVRVGGAEDVVPASFMKALPELVASKIRHDDSPERMWGAILRPTLGQ